MASGIINLSYFINLSIIYDTPSSITNINIINLREKLSVNNNHNVLVSFCGEVSGLILLCFNKEYEKIMYTFVNHDYLMDANNSNYFIESFLYESGSIFTGGSLISLCDFICYNGYEEKIKKIKLEIQEIKVNININYLKLQNATENIFVTKLDNNSNNGYRLFTSYIMFDKINVDYLLHNVYKI